MLKARRLSGVDTLILRQSGRGSFSVAREWTDWGPPSPYAELGITPQRLDFNLLLDLTALLEQLADQLTKGHQSTKGLAK